MSVFKPAILSATVAPSSPPDDAKEGSFWRFFASLGPFFSLGFAGAPPGTVAVQTVNRPSQAASSIVS